MGNLLSLFISRLMPPLLIIRALVNSLSSAFHHLASEHFSNVPFPHFFVQTGFNELFDLVYILSPTDKDFLFL